MQRPRDAAVIEALASLLWARASPYQVVAETSMRSQKRINRWYARSVAPSRQRDSCQHPLSGPVPGLAARGEQHGYAGSEHGRTRPDAL